MKVFFATTAATFTTLLWSNNNMGVHAAIGCPCVQDLVTFKFDLGFGCRKNIINPSDYTRTSCTVNDSSNSRVKKVVIHDHQSATTTSTLPVFWSSSEEEEEDDALDASSYYYFQYHRSGASPSVLFMDLFDSSNTLSASVDLYFATSNRNCVVSSSPIFWPSDTLYFLTVVRCLSPALLIQGCTTALAFSIMFQHYLLSSSTDTTCYYSFAQMNVQETSDPMCHFPHADAESVAAIAAA
jgi:hypothetical protein